MPLDFRQQISKTIFRIHTKFVKQPSILLHQLLKKHIHYSSKNNRVGDLHHRGLHVQRKEQPTCTGVLDFIGYKLLQRRHIHHCCVDDLPLLKRNALFQYRLFPVGIYKYDRSHCCRIHRNGLLTAKKIAMIHTRHVRFRVR